MKILVPTDFSKIANFALETAIDIAMNKGAEIHLYHCANIPNDWEDLPAETRYHDKLNKQIAIKARDRLKIFSDRVKSKGIDCNVHFTGGKLIKDIEEVFAEINVDLIVMGSHGASGKREWFIGSNAQKILRKHRKDTLVVKKLERPFDPKELLFVTNLNKEDRISFKKFLSFSKSFNVNTIHILCVDTSSFFTQPTIIIEDALKDFKAIAKEFKVETHFYRDYSVEAGVRHFVAKNNIDLVGISNHAKKPFKHIFQGSNVEMIVNHSDIPVLSLDY